jgi:hypothetical protein
MPGTADQTGAWPRARSQRSHRRRQTSHRRTARERRDQSEQVLEHGVILPAQASQVARQKNWHQGSGPGPGRH